MAGGGRGNSEGCDLHVVDGCHRPWNTGFHFMVWEGWMVREQFAKADIASVHARLAERWRRGFWYEKIYGYAPITNEEVVKLRMQEVDKFIRRLNEEKEIIDEEFASGEEQEPTGGKGTGYIRVDREVA